MDLIELTCLKPFDKETVEASLKRTHKLAMLDESTRSGGVGATMSALINETLFDELDAPEKRLCMEDAPVPYATEMEKEMVKRASDLIAGVREMC